MDVPEVMQAPIGPAATPALVAAVSNAGGLGCLAASWTSLPSLRDQLGAIRCATDRPFAVNLVLAFDQAERLALLIGARVPVITFPGASIPLRSRGRRRPVRPSASRCPSRGWHR